MKSELKKYDNITADDAQFVSDIKAIVYTAKQKAYQAADIYQVVSNLPIGQTVSDQFEIRHNIPNLSWSHYERLL
ncbi:MAG: hypothetical protein K2I19_01380 [Muribaculaceae bacterium]|nr:hypothetical protein [Muribaculaceae bacterium]